MIIYSFFSNVSYQSYVNFKSTMKVFAVLINIGQLNIDSYITYVNSRSLVPRTIPGGRNREEKLGDRDRKSSPRLPPLIPAEC